MIDYSKGSLKPKDDLTLPYIWVSLHLNAQMEQETLANPRLSRETARMSGEIEYLLDALREVEFQKWWDVCEASGWTVYGAVGLSWCKGASAHDFWRAWTAAEYPLVPGASTERPCHFINPEILPQTTKLTQLIADCGNVCEPICVCIAAMKDTLVIDVNDAQVAQAEPTLRAFLNSRHDHPQVGEG
jgi:hypothetical protein